MKSKKTVGILGGMGPQASIKLYEQIIEKSSTDHQAKRGSDFPHLLISNLPIPDLIQNDKDLSTAVEMLSTEAKNLQQAGADFLVMACNTMHLFQAQITKNLHIPFHSLIDHVIEEILKRKIKKIGLLGSTTTVNSGLYSEPLKQLGVQVITPHSQQQEQLAYIIKKIIAKSLTKNDHQVLKNIMKNLHEQDVQTILLGCTELPLVIKNEDSKVPLIRSLDLLATKTCEQLYALN